VHDFDEMREIQRTWKFELLSFRLVALALNGQPKIVVRLVLKRHLVFECLFDLRVLLALGIMFMNARGGSCGGTTSILLAWHSCCSNVAQVQLAHYDAISRFRPI